MTRQEAIMKLEMLIDLSQQNELKNMHEALSIAIRSLEAWDKVLAYIDDRYEIRWTSDDYEGGIKDACTDIEKEIYKYLKEVENK